MKESSDSVSGALGFFSDDEQIAPQGACRAELFQKKACEPEDARERRVDSVSDTRCEISQDCDPSLFLNLS